MQSIVIEGVSEEIVRKIMPEKLDKSLTVGSMIVLRDGENCPIVGWDIKTIEDKVYILLPEEMTARVSTALKHYLKDNGMRARFGSYAADLGVWEARQAN